MRTFSILLTVAAALAACTTAPPNVRVEQDPVVDLASFKTFAFEPMPDIGYTSIVARRLEQATREQMQARGYAYDPDRPDLRVHWRLKVAERQELRSTPAGPAWRGTHGLEMVSWRQGTLRIDLVDTRRHAAVWQGVAEGRVDPKAEKEPGASVVAAVNEIFAAWPGSR